MTHKENLRPIKPHELAELAWRVLFLRGVVAVQSPHLDSLHFRSWFYSDDKLWIEDFETREYLTVRARYPASDARVLLSKKQDVFDTFVPEDWVIDHLERLLVLDTLANL
jgi:hypothetical protein